MVVLESRKSHKVLACKSINSGWSYGGFSKAWKLPYFGQNFQYCPLLSVPYQINCVYDFSPFFSHRKMAEFTLLSQIRPLQVPIVPILSRTPSLLEWDNPFFVPSR